MSGDGKAATDWDARQYLTFEDERTRPARDLLAQVPLQRVRRAVDLGCGPGNSTELIANRYPDAKVTGLDSSKNMLSMARERLPGCEFIEADVASWTPQEPIELLFANAMLHWIPKHQMAMRRMLEALPEGGVLAAQMPDNTREPSHILMRELAKRGAWADHSALATRVGLPSSESYYEALKPVCRSVEIWQTLYEHVMDGPQAIVEWFKGSALRPFLAALDASMAGEFLDAYTEDIARNYQPRFDGKILLRFPRLFVVAKK